MVTFIGSSSEFELYITKKKRKGAVEVHILKERIGKGEYKEVEACRDMDKNGLHDCPSHLLFDV